jgi:excisionase family DNA binding protein
MHWYRLIVNCILFVRFRAWSEAMDQLVSVEEAARRLGGISKWTVHAWLSQGRMRRVKVGSRTMIRESELQKVIQDGGKSLAPERKGESSW